MSKDKLEKLKEVLKLLQNDTVRPEEIKKFLELVLGVISKSRAEFSQLSAENLAKIDKALTKIEEDHISHLVSVNHETLRVKTELSDKLKEAQTLLKQAKAIKVRDGVDGLDGKNPDPKEVVPLVLKELPKAEPFVLKRLEVVEEINTGKKDDLKIELKQIEKGLITKKDLDFAIGVLDQRTQFLINKVSNLQIEVDNAEVSVGSIGGTITGGTTGSVLFVNPTGVIAQDNANFSFDDTTNNLTVGGSVLHGDGTSANNAVSFTADPNTGLYRLGSDNLAFSAGGARMSLDTARLRVLSSIVYSWVPSSNLFTTPDTGLSRGGVGKVYVGNGTAGDFSGTLWAANLSITGKTTAFLTGTIDATASTAVVGVGTLFTTQLEVGDRLNLAGVLRTVTAITDDTNLTVDSAYTDIAIDNNPEVLYQISSWKTSTGVTRVSINDIGTLELTGANIQLGNNQFYKSRLTTGVAVNLMGYSSSNFALIGANSELSLGGSVAIQPNGVEMMRFVQDAVLVYGRAGLGSTTPVTRLDIAGNVRQQGRATTIITGSINPTASTAVVGVGTTFTTKLVVGDRITVTGETRTITAITDATNLTVDAAFTDNADDSSPDVLYAIHTWKLSSNAVTAVINDLGNWGIGGVIAPTAKLHLGAGTATANTAPLKLTSGTNNTTAETGAFEYNGTNLFFTRTGTTREGVLVGTGGAAAPGTSVGIGIVNYYGSSATNFLGDPVGWFSIVDNGGTTRKVPYY